MESMKYADIHDVYDNLWKKHRINELRSLAINYDTTELSKKIESQFESILLKLERVLEIQTMKNSTDPHHVDVEVENE